MPKESQEHDKKYTGQVRLREVRETDLPIFYEHQSDPAANQMAAFPAREWDPFMAHWAKIMANPDLFKMTVIYDGQVVGNVVSFPLEGHQEVGYWIGRSFWGKGIATRALAQLLELVTVRPLYAHVVNHNIASRRVLEKCGFSTLVQEGEEIILMLYK